MPKPRTMPFAPEGVDLAYFWLVFRAIFLFVFVFNWKRRFVVIYRRNYHISLRRIFTATELHPMLLQLVVVGMTLLNLFHSFHAQMNLVCFGIGSTFALEVPLPWRIVPWLRDGLSLQLLRNLCRISRRGTEVLSFLGTTTLALTEAGLFLARSGINRWKNRNYLSFHGWNGRKKYQPSRNPWRCFANGILQFLRIDDYE